MIRISGIFPSLRGNLDVRLKRRQRISVFDGRYRTIQPRLLHKIFLLSWLTLDDIWKTVDFDIVNMRFDYERIWEELGLMKELICIWDLLLFRSLRDEWLEKRKDQRRHKSGFFMPTRSQIGFVSKDSLLKRHLDNTFWTLSDTPIHSVRFQFVDTWPNGHQHR